MVGIELITDARLVYLSYVLQKKKILFSILRGP